MVVVADMEVTGWASVETMVFHHGVFRGLPSLPKIGSGI